MRSSLRVKKILVPFDNSKNAFRALNVGVSLANKFNASVILFHVAYVPPYGGFQRSNADKVKAMTYVKRIMSEATKICKKKNIIYEEIVKYGDSPGEIITKFVNKSSNKIDLIVTGSRGSSLTHNIFFGSTSNHVLHKSKIPVLLIK